MSRLLRNAKETSPTQAVQSTAVEMPAPGWLMESKVDSLSDSHAEVPPISTSNWPTAIDVACT